MILRYELVEEHLRIGKTVGDLPKTLGGYLLINLPARETGYQLHTTTCKGQVTLARLKSQGMVA